MGKAHSTPPPPHSPHPAVQQHALTSELAFGLGGVQHSLSRLETLGRGSAGWAASPERLV